MLNLNYLKYTLFHITLNNHHKFKQNLDILGEITHERETLFTIALMGKKREVNYIKILGYLLFLN